MEKGKANSKKYIIIVSALAAVLVVVGIVLGVGIAASGASGNDTTVHTKDGSANDTTSQNSQTETTFETEAVTSVIVPEKLETYLDDSDVTSDVLSSAKCQQLIVVDTSGVSANISFYEQKNYEWQEKEQLSCNGFIGVNGISENKKEGDGCTPVGLYEICSAFYIDDSPQTGLDVFQITDESYWVDDPKSEFYNQYVVGDDKKDWDSAEHMIYHSAYRYGFVVGYNTACEPGLGSAIFFHVGNSPTAGCVAVSEELILDYLQILDKEKNPFVLVL